MILLYNIFIRVYLAGIRLVSLWNAKAKEWIKGRQELFLDLEQKISSSERIIWMHCASAGEFEQGKPVIETLKEQYPLHKIVVSFFSPSGYKAAQKYPHADVITYLPADTKKNAERFIELVHPEVVIFIKYEYWYHHLSAAASQDIPVLMASAIYRKEQAFFKWYGAFYRKMLFFFRQIFVQDQASIELLKAHGIPHCSIAGDTRFDRVKNIAFLFSELPVIKEFAGENLLIVAGSTWPDDEKLLAEYVKYKKTRIIVAPHEITTSHIQSIQANFPNPLLFSQIKNAQGSPDAPATSIWNSINQQQQTDLHQKLKEAQTLVIDNIGMLSRLYHYATITYIGGGFNKSGIHNTLEAAVYGKPVLFGPYYQKFKEARDLVAAGGAFSISSKEELKTKMDHLLDDPNLLSQSSEASKNYVENNTGATEKVLQFIQENRLLTS